MPSSTEPSVYKSSTSPSPNRPRIRWRMPPSLRMPIHAYVRTSMLIHMGSVMHRIRTFCAFSLHFEIKYAAGYPRSRQISVVFTAMAMDLHKISRKSGSVKNFT